MSASTCDLDGTFRRCGYYFPFEALTGPEVKRLNREIDAAVSALGNDPNALKRGKLNEHYSFIDAISRKKAVLDLIETAIGPDIMCWAAGVFSKPPRSRLFTPWHQDYYSWGLVPGDAVTVWLALTEVDAGNGCMEFVADDRWFTELDHDETFDPDSMLSHGQRISSVPDDVARAPCVLRPGQASLHHVNTVHRSGPNPSPRERRGLVIRYVAGHVEQTKFAKDSAVLVRGTARSKSITIVPGPARVAAETSQQSGR